MSWLSSIFKGNKKQDTSYTGQRPATDLRQVGGGQEYYDAISGRLKGQGVGYGEQYADQVSSPIIARMRNQFSSYDVPELQSQLTAQGRRKSSGGFDQLRRAYTDQSLAEGDVYANLYRENEAQKRNEINDALARMGAYAADNATLLGQRAAFDQSDYQNQLKIADSQRQQGGAAFGRLLGTAALGLQGIGGMGGGTASVMPQFSSTDFYSNMYQPWGQGGSMNDRVARKVAYQGGYMPYQTRLK